uniref:Lipid binding protein n=1 Tax=Rhizophora mucronata TaxID=61149 RepID=A0A2P2L3I6_RHIMU
MLHLGSGPPIPRLQRGNVESSTLKMCSNITWLWTTILMLSRAKQYNITSIIISTPIAHIAKITRPDKRCKPVQLKSVIEYSSMPIDVFN